MEDKKKVVELEEFVEKVPEKTDIERKLVGLPKEWTLLNWEDNMIRISSKENILKTMIEDQLDRYSEIKKDLTEEISLLKKMAGDLSDSPLYSVYERAMELNELLSRVITILFLWWKIQTGIISDLASLLREGKKYSYLKTKEEIELNALKEVTSSLTTVVNSFSDFKKQIFDLLSNMRSEQVKEYGEVLKKVMEVGGITDLTPIQDRLDELEERLDKMERRKYQPQPQIFQPAITQRPQKKIYDEMVDLIKSGVTDKADAATILRHKGYDITPQGLAVRGWKSLVEKFAVKEEVPGEETGEKAETEEINQVPTKELEEGEGEDNE